MTELRRRMIDAMTVRGLSVRTHESYIAAVRGLAKHYRRCPGDLTVQEVQAYLVHLITVRKLSWSTCNIAVQAFKFLYHIVLGRDRVEFELPAPKQPQRLPEILSREEVSRLIEAPPNPKHRLLLATAYAGGLRVGEVVQLRVADLDRGRMTLRVEQGKGRKDRVLPLSRKLLGQFEAYWETEPARQWLFPNRNGNRHVDITVAQKVFTMAKLRTGITKRGGIHGLRHAFATHLIESGADVPTVQRLLGHRSVSTTMRYFHLSQARLAAIRSPLDWLDAYDDFNRLQYAYFNGIVPENPGSVFIKYAYFDDGQRQSEQDPEGHVTTFAYDELKRLATVTQTVGVDTLTTSYGYDVQDNLASVTDPSGLITTYTNHDMGWRLGIDSPDTGNTSFEYDPAGNLTSTTNANGVTSTRTYDALDRLTFVTYPDSSLNVTQTYDSGAVTFGIGRRTGMTDASGSTVYGYDRRGLPTREEKTIGAAIYLAQYAYDKTGNLTQILHPTDDAGLRQGQADYTYDAADRATSITAKVNGSPASVAASIAYKPFGPRTSLTFGNGLLDSRTYGTRYQLGTWTLGSLLSYTHVFDDDLNLASRTDNLNGANNRTFGYDEIHRLTAAAGPWGAGTACTGGMTYTYDLNGNRMCKGEASPATSYTYLPGTNQLDEATGGEAASYGYDNNGNTTGDGTHTYEYSDADRLASVDSGSTATYTYDGDGRRIIKSVGSTTTYFFYDPTGRLLAETVPAAGSGKDYLYLRDAPIGRVDWTTEQALGDVLRVSKNDPNVHLDWTLYPAASNTYVVRRKQVVDPSDKTFDGAEAIATLTDPTQTYDDPVLNDGNDSNYRVFRRALDESLFFYHTDHVGTPIALTDASATLVWRAEHRPFGGVHNLPTSTVANNLRFPGQYSDSESGLHQNWHRDYQPQTGRLLQSDPLGLDGGPNLYGYALANPVVNVDPWGLFSYNAPPPRTQPLHGDALALANCMEQCLGTSFVVTGGSECTPDGRHVPGGMRGSRHCTNQAFDVRPGGMDRRKVLCCAAKCGAGYAGDEGDHWHFQTVPGRNNSSGLIGTADRTCCVPQSTGGRP